MNRVSLYIPCFNASGYLKECLEAVLKQTYPIYEILVIDDGSTDDTLKIASTFSVRCISNERNLGLAAVRNIAIRQAKGDLIASLDADCSPDPFWLQRLMEDITDERIAGAGGRVLEKEGGLADIWRKNHMPQDWGKDRIINPQFLYGANTLFRKNSLEAVGLYNEEYKTNNEDVDISTRLRQKGFSLVYDPQALSLIHI